MLVVIGLAAVGAVAWLFVRRPALLPLLAAAALPFRIPLDVGGDTANLLLPLYLVVGRRRASPASCRAAARPRRGASAGRARWSGRSPRCSSSTARRRPTRATSTGRWSTVVFFYVPFAVLFVPARAGPVDAAPGRAWTLGVLVVLALALVGVGFWEYATQHLLLNPKVIDSNQFEYYFRVNSLFFDPNIYGRFLAS